MNHTQAFRVSGSAGIEKISVDTIHGQNVIFWENIEQVFARVRVVKNGDVVINILRDPNGVRYVPHRIQHFPDDVLDLVLSEHHPTDYPSSTLDSNSTRPSDCALYLPPTNNVDPPSYPTALFSETISDLAVAQEPIDIPLSTEPRHATLTRANTAHIQDQLNAVNMAVQLANQSGTPMSSEELSSLIRSKLTPVPISLGFENTVNYKLDVIHSQGAMTQNIAREVLDLQKQMNDRLILIQSKTEAILTQQIGLAEYPIPRLFIVLPEEPTKFDPANWLRTKFRLYFICECGEHTQATGSKIPHHIHLAKHEGYPVREPTELFRKYGPFLLLMLEMIKLGTIIAGHVVPALANLKVVELVDSVQQNVATVSSKIDYSLQCIDRQMERLQESSLGVMDNTDQRASVVHQNLANYLSCVEGLEGVELRQLRSFLKTSNKDNVLGNLYRMTTSDGHVKWVCRDHYRAGYQEAHTQKLRDVVTLVGGTFDEQLGKIDIALTSSFAASEFYDALRKARGVLELIVCLKWECTRKDIEALQDAVKISLVSTLHVDLRQFRPNLVIQRLSVSARYDVLHRLLEPINLTSIHIILPKDVLRVSNFAPKKPPHLRRLTYEIILVSLDTMYVRTLAETVNTGHTRVSLLLSEKSTEVKGAQALFEALETKWPFTVLDLSYTSIGDNGVQALSEALTTDPNLTTLSLCYDGIGDKGVQAISEALKINSTLRFLDLGSNTIGDKGAQTISEMLKTNSTLTTLNLGSSSIGEKGAQALFETLRFNTTLTTLNLGSNSIKDKGALILIELLKINRTLSMVDLTNNAIGEKGTQAIFELLKTNSTLTSLTLSRNTIEEKGVQVLSKALKTNSTLIFLGLEGLWIGDKEVLLLSEALKINSTLTTLDLTSNAIKEDGALALSEAIKINSSLTTLNLSHNMVRKKGAQALLEARKSNPTLTLSMKGIMMG